VSLGTERRNEGGLPDYCANGTSTKTNVSVDWMHAIEQACKDPSPSLAAMCVGVTKMRANDCLGGKSLRWA
jgi:hypothetical protein